MATVIVTGCYCVGRHINLTGSVDGTAVTTQVMAQDVTNAGNTAAQQRFCAQALLDNLPVEQTALHATVTL